MPFFYNSDSHLNHEMTVVSLGVIISAMVYGGVAALALTYIPLLLNTSHTISRRMRNFLLAYVAFMVAISTVNTVTLIIAFLGLLQVEHASSDKMVNMYAFPHGLAGALCVAFASWGADGFMLWRCAVLYEGISRPRRLATLTVLILMAMASLGFGTLLLIKGSFLLILVIVIITTIINTTAAILIAARILYFQRNIRPAGSKRDSQYTTIIIICIESSALIVVFSILYAILFAKLIPASFIFMQILVYVNVISPLLIVYRVALGKAVTSSPRRSKDGLVVSALDFASTGNNGSRSDPECGQSLRSGGLDR